MPEKIIQEKVRLGVLCLRCLIAVTRKKAELFIVYNLERNPLPNQLKKGVVQESPSRLAIANYIADKAGEEHILFDLERYQKLYFREVHTYSKEKFAEYLKRQEI